MPFIPVSGPSVTTTPLPSKPLPWIPPLLWMPEPLPWMMLPLAWMAVVVVVMGRGACSGAREKALTQGLMSGEVTSHRPSIEKLASWGVCGG